MKALEAQLEVSHKQITTAEREKTQTLNKLQEVDSDVSLMKRQVHNLETQLYVPILTASMTVE